MSYGRGQHFWNRDFLKIFHFFLFWKPSSCKLQPYVLCLLSEFHRLSHSSATFSTLQLEPSCTCCRAVDPARWKFFRSLRCLVNNYSDIFVSTQVFEKWSSTISRFRWWEYSHYSLIWFLRRSYIGPNLIRFKWLYRLTHLTPNTSPLTNLSLDWFLSAWYFSS